MGCVLLVMLDVGQIGLVEQGLGVERDYFRCVDNKIGMSIVSIYT